MEIPSDLNAPRMKRSLTESVGPDALARLLARRARMPRASAQERPDAFLADVEVRVTRTALSPYVIHLDPPPCLEDGACLMPINLLEARPLEAAPPEGMPPLSLAREDVAAQLSEDLAVARPLTLPPRAFPADRPLGLMLAREEGFPIETLVPPSAPVDIAAYLELPEADDEDAGEAPGDDEGVEVIELEIAGMMPEPSYDPLMLPLGRSIAPPTGEALGKGEAASYPSPMLGAGMGEVLGAVSWRAAASFAALAVAVVSPLVALGALGTLKGEAGRAQAAGFEALADLSAASGSALGRDLAAASASFASAGARFSQAQEAIDGMGAGVRAVAAAIPGGGPIKAAQRLSEAGESIALAGERVSDGLSALQLQVHPTPTSRIALIATYFRSALPHLAAARDALAGVDAQDVPEAQRETLALAQERLPALVSGLDGLLRYADAALTVLGGDEGPKRYLLVFQNDAELRPTGGFMGSFAEVEVSHGEIVSMHVPPGGTYDLRGTLTEFLAAPGPLRLLSARWEFQDANWSPDFPTSARQMLEFYSAAGGATVDGVVAVNSSLLPDMLEMLGSVELPGYGRTMDAENVLFETQRIVELEYDREENAPKAVIGDLARALMARASEIPASAFPALADRLAQALAERDVQLYFADQDLERQVRELGWGGELKWTPGDALMVVHANLGGGKTDSVIREEVDVAVDIAEDGTVTDTVKVTRTHFGEPGALFTGVNNVDYLRLYVPKGSTLVSASGFSPPDPGLFEVPDGGWKVDDDLYYEEQLATTHEATGVRVSEEAGRTVFGAWVQTKPGTSSTAAFSYRLPLRVDPSAGADDWLARVRAWAGTPSLARYSLLLQSQSGVASRATRVRVRAPESLREVWASHELSGVTFDARADAFLAALFEPAP